MISLFNKTKLIKNSVVLSSKGLERTFYGACLELKIVPPKAKLKRKILSITKSSTRLIQWDFHKQHSRDQ